jgi:hypothetical protein
MKSLLLLLVPLLAGAAQSNGVVSVKGDKAAYQVSDRAKISVFQILDPSSGRKIILESTFDETPIQLVPSGVRWQMALTAPLVQGTHSFLTHAYDVSAATFDGFTQEIAALNSEKADVQNQLNHDPSPPVRAALEKRLGDINAELAHLGASLRSQYREIGTALDFPVVVN